MLDRKFPLSFIPENDDFRVKSLSYYEILDTHSEKEFNNIAEIAKKTFDASFATVNFVNQDSIFFKAQTENVFLTDIPRKSVFGYAILSEKPIQFEDINSSQDLDNIIDRSFPEFKFFAAAPIINSEGYILGSITVMDDLSKKATSKQLSILTLLADLVMDKLETRIATRKILRTNDDRLNLLVHDLKNPMTTISLQSELMGRIPGSDEKVSLIANRINSQSKNIVDKLNHILSSGIRVNGSFKLQKTKVNLSVILIEVSKKLSLALNKKGQKLNIIRQEVEIFGDEQKLIEIFENLIGNASKYSPSNTEINTDIMIGDNKIIIKIIDNGVGLSEEDLNQLFIKFANLKAVPTHKENSNGLGLSTAKMLIDMHKGTLWAESKGINLGTSFFVELPIK